MSNIPGLENITGLTRAELNNVIMNYLVTGTVMVRYFGLSNRAYTVLFCHCSVHSIVSHILS